ncbi:MAG: hypothetical protein H0T17_05320 [Propionibacteriales bacterium]|nr:hypothetical protein [Propionibacteriales bacterium]
MATRVLDEPPSLGSLYLRVALRSLAGLAWVPARRQPDEALPATTLELHGLSIDAEHLRRYRQICGFEPGVGVPSTYPHVLAFPLNLALMTERGFPLSVVGAVHVENTIEQFRALTIDSVFDLATWATELRPHHRGRTVTTVSEARVEGQVVWRNESVFLSRDKGAGDSLGARADVRPDVPAVAPAGPMEWRLDAELGRRYAAVSGDRNPIHLYAVTAKAFGFKAQIAHGMWTKARSLAALSHRLPSAYRVVVAFKKPVSLPTTVRLGARESGSVIDFGLTSARCGAPHLIGRVTRL